MAIFNDTRELSTQKRHVGMKRMTGFRKQVAALAGYKDDGTKNWWGKIGGTKYLLGKGVVGESIQRGVGQWASKGSDANQVFKETNDEFFQSKLAEVNMNLEGAKLAAKVVGGVPGGGDVAGGNVGTGDLGTGDVSTMSDGAEVSSGIGTEGMSGSESSISTENLNNYLGKKGKDLIEDQINKTSEKLSGNKTDKELVKDLTEEEEEDGVTDVDEEALKKKNKFTKANEKFKNVTDKIPVAGKFLSTMSQYRTSYLNLENEADRISSNLKRKTAKENEFNYL